MKTKATRSSLLLAIAYVLVSMPSVAGTIYENGPVNGQTDSWTINFGYVVSDSFTLTSGANVNGIEFWAWLFPGDTLTSVQATITSQANGGTTFFNQVLNPTQSKCFANNLGFEVCLETSSLLGTPLAGGIYYLNLQNASVPNGDPVYWDENSGAGCKSAGCPSMAVENFLGTIPSEAFTISGSLPVSEPSGVMVMFGGGVLAFAGLFLRRLTVRYPKPPA